MTHGFTCAAIYFQVMHGGLFSEDNVTLDDIRTVDRNRQPPETGMETKIALFVLVCRNGKIMIISMCFSAYIEYFSL